MDSKNGALLQTSSSANSPFDPTNYIHKKPLENCTAIDLFCGAGGLTYGLNAAGISVAAGIDFDENCKYPYEKNNASTFVHEDISKVTSDAVDQYYADDDIKVLVGCAPCQDFSRYSRAKRADGSDRWSLLNEFTRLIREIDPDIVSMENVVEIQHHPIFDVFLQHLLALGYQTTATRAYCPEYGVPQTRERIVVLASKLGPISMVKPKFDSPEKYPTLKHVIGEMEMITAGAASPHDPLHRCSKLEPINLKRIGNSIPGGTWRDWPEELRSKCHRKQSGKTYSGVYGRMEWDKPAPTITTQFFGYGNGRFGHPIQDRAISLREGALLQSFPRNYQFVSSDAKVVFSAIGRLIGNAVPPRLGLAVGESIRQHIENWRGLNVKGQKESTECAVN